jgi:DNA-binding transcriptional regulator PaaX
MRQPQIGKLIFEVSDHILETVTDIILAEIFFSFSAMTARNSYEIYRASENVGKIIEYEFNYQTIKRALSRLSQMKLITKTRSKSKLEIQITKLGYERIKNLFPIYQTIRPWDGYLYLISYDIPINYNFKRNKLRFFMKKIGCGILQQSFWLTPYNPTQVVSDFVKANNIPGTTLVSRLGKDGSIGEESTKDLIYRVYNISQLAKEYEDFLDNYSNTKNASAFEISLNYFKILKKDPQLPFELLPKNFPDKKAYQLINKLLINHPINARASS